MLLRTLILLALCSATSAGQGVDTHAAGPVGLGNLPPELPETFAAPAEQQAWSTRKEAEAPAELLESVKPQAAQSEATSLPRKELLLGPSRKSQTTVEQPRRPKQLTDYVAWQLPADPIVTAGTALGVVLGIFVLAAWLMKRSLPASQRAVPEEVATVIGRVPLAGKQMAQLVKVGPKLVLVALNPDGAKPLTEITDPVEVQRLLALCQHRDRKGSSAAFEEIFSQLSSEPAPRGFLGDETPVIDRQRLADAYANTPGGRRRG
jgi:flagellar biogenesis protein FliO